jgi:galactose oxidase-like protein/IPT/TIG domain-containing protein/PKD domain-containing protein
MNRFPFRLFVPACLLLLGLASSAPPALAQSSGQGRWQTLPNPMPINPVHAALLHDGKVLVVSGSGNLPSNTNFQAGVFNPQTGTVTTQPVSWDMFCNGMVVLPDGRAFINGGTLQYDPFHGELRSAVYDLTTGAFTDVQSMAHGRWYPTVTTLGDGTLMTFSGLSETGGTNTSIEIYSVSTGWSTQIGSPFTPPLYPRMHLLPNGKVFYSGSTAQSRLFDPVAKTWSGVIATTNYGGTRTYGTSVLLSLTPANNYKPVVMIMGGGNPSTATTELIDLSAATPKWTNGPSMSQPRIEMNATILPNGKILALGGSLNDEDTGTASLNADLYDPATNTFSSAGMNAFARLYHSNSLLLPDGTVWFAGGNPARGTYEHHMEIYSPAYLFNPDGTLATRPAITGVPSSGIGYGSAFQVQTPDAASISSVVLMRPGAPTHAFDMEQRLVAMNFTAGSGVLNVTAPPNGNIAPPGYYMLFILNNTGVPSIAIMVRVSAVANDVPPTGTITSPVSNVTISAGQSVFYSGTGSDPDGTISAYSWSFPGGNPSSSNLANPGSVTYSTPGTYVTTFTVTDNVGLTDPTPPTRTITVQPDFSLSASPSSQTVVTGSGTSFTATVTASTGFSGTVSLSVSGLPAGATPSFSPASISTSGSSTLSVSTSSSTAPGSYPLTVTATSGTLTHTTNVTLVVMATSGGTGIALVQHTSLNSSGTSATLAFNLNNTAGNWIGVCIRAGAVNETFTVMDSNGNTYRKAIQFSETGNGNKLGIFYAENIRGGANTVTVSDTTSATLRFTVLEYSGIAASGSLDGTAVAQGNSASANSGNATTTANGDMLLGTIMTSGTAAFTAGTGYKIEESVPAEPSTKLIAEDQVQTTARAASASASLGAADFWAAGVAAFKAAGSGGGTAPSITSLNPTSGPVGTSVTITGTNFGSTGTVTFGVTTATVTSWNATSIATSVPTGVPTGNVNVVVTVNGVASNGVTFTVTSGGTGIALVQHTSKDAGTTNSSTLTFPSNNTAGNWIGICIRAGAVNETFTVMDSRGNTYHKAIQFSETLDGNSFGIYYAENIAGGVNTVTVSNTTSATLRFAILEYSGVATLGSLDVVAATQGNSATPNSGVTATTTANGDLLLGAIMTANSATFTAGTGFIIEESVPAEPGTKLIAEDQIQARAGAATASASLGAADFWAAGVAAFKP